jgi:glycosyltransferase involved in cell wall biosynthesis
MILQDIGDLPPVEEQVVIINVNTKIVTTLALLSALRYAEMPILIVDCKSTDGSYEYFSRLMKDFRFDLLSAPLKRHGLTLNWLFSCLPSKKVLLIDSDAELRTSEIIKLAHEYIDDENTFGFGFVDGPCWWARHEIAQLFQEAPDPPRGYFEERPWLPFVMFKTSIVREAIQAGYSFVERTVYNDFAPSQFISRILMKRYHFSFFRNSKLAWLNPFKRSFHGHKPSWVLYDTGAEIYQYLKYGRGYDFVGLPVRFHPRYVSHYWGVTRLLVYPRDTYIQGTPLTKIQSAVLNRLNEAYGFSPEQTGR